MKKPILIACILSLASIPLRAQEHEEQPSERKLSYEVNIGVGLGFLSQTFSGADHVDSKSTIGSAYQVSMTLLYPLKPRFELETGLCYQRKSGGTETTLSGLGTPITEKFSLRFHYLTVPLHVRYWFVEKKLYAYGGLGIGFCINASQEFDGNSTTLDDHKTLGLTFDLGIGYSFAKDLSIGIGSGIGLTKAIGKGNRKATPHTLMLIGAIRF